MPKTSPKDPSRPAARPSPARFGLGVLVAFALVLVSAPAADAFVYWTNFNVNGTIGRADADGSNANQSFITGARLPHGLAVSGAHAYWANFGNDAIGRANLDGTGTNQSFITGGQF